jgi:putative ABC transport system permease protein
MNLSTARSASRAKEVGLRKVSGAFRFQLIQQFLGEAALLSFLSFLLALGMVELALPRFSAIVGRNLSFDRSGIHLLWMLGFVGLVGLLAGSYPAFFLSAFEPVVVLKGHLKTGLQGVLLRKGLVVFQFAMSILLIIGTVTVYRQLNYVKNRILGFNKENLIRIPIFHRDRGRKADPNTYLGRRYQAVKQVFLAHPGVLSATAHSMPIGSWDIRWREEWGGTPRTVKLEGNESYWMLEQIADEDFLQTFKIDLVAGRNLSPIKPGGAARVFECLVNETAIKQFGWENPIGKKIRGELYVGTVVGVVKDFHSQSLRQKIRLIRIYCGCPPYVVVRGRG